jgi:hypothetical protein
LIDLLKINFQKKFLAKTKTKAVKKEKEVEEEQKDNKDLVHGNNQATIDEQKEGNFSIKMI